MWSYNLDRYDILKPMSCAIILGIKQRHMFSPKIVFYV